VLSNATNLLGRGPAFFLLLLVAALSIVSLIVARRVELASAGQALTAELQDLDQYRDVLASDDITAVRGIHTVATARADLGRAVKQLRPSTSAAQPPSSLSADSWLPTTTHPSLHRRNRRSR
jgi:hypothetical protein